MLTGCRGGAACVLRIGVTAFSVVISGCKETGETVRDMGSKFSQGLTEKDRASIVKVEERIHALKEQLEADSNAQVKAEKVSPRIMETMNSGLGEIDVSTCPDDYRKQFYKYKADFGVATNDFEEFANYTNDHQNDWLGDPKTEIARLRHRFDQAVNEADSDVSELYAIGHKYGV